MGEAYFYHLTRTPLETTLPMLLDKARGAGWRVAVRCTNPDRMAWLDERLWLGSEEAFLPHGIAGGPHDADQPVLLTTGKDQPNGATCIMAIDGAPVAPNEVSALQRVCILFDGNDPAALAAARDQWRDLTRAGCGAQYWSQEDGGWKMKATSAGT